MPEDWQNKKNKKRRARRRQVLIYKMLIVFVLLLVMVAIVLIASGKRSEADHIPTVPPSETAMEPTMESDQLLAATPSQIVFPVEETEEQDSLTGYENQGIADVSDYLNIREEAQDNAAVIGRIPADGICEILEEGETWFLIRYGDVEGYVNGVFLRTGED